MRTPYYADQWCAKKGRLKRIHGRYEYTEAAFEHALEEQAPRALEIASEELFPFEQLNMENEKQFHADTIRAGSNAVINGHASTKVKNYLKMTLKLKKEGLPPKVKATIGAEDVEHQLAYYEESPEYLAILEKMKPIVTHNAQPGMSLLAEHIGGPQLSGSRSILKAPTSARRTRSVNFQEETTTAEFEFEQAPNVMGLSYQLTTHDEKDSRRWYAEQKRLIKSRHTSKKPSEILSKEEDAQSGAGYKMAV